MSMDFVKVYNESDDQIIELPLEEDNTLLLTTLNTLFPLATGLKYKNPEGTAFRTLKCHDGKIYAPPEGWNPPLFYCTFPKDFKRKTTEEEYGSLNTKNQRLDKKQCTDIIILGLAWKTDEHTIRDYFAQFGELAMVQVKRHPVTNQSKGFGFIRFVEYGAQASCLSERHYIDGRWCEVKIPESKLYADKQEVTRKVYVGGLSENITTEMLRETFLQFGIVTDVFIPKPFRNFAFVTFADHNVAQGLLGKQVACHNLFLNVQAAAPKLPSVPRQINSYQQTSQRPNEFYGLQQNAGDQNAVTLAAVNMLRDPNFISSLLNFGPGNQPSGVSYMDQASSNHIGQYGRSGAKFN